MIRKQNLYINTILILILFSIFTTTVNCARNEKSNLKKQEVMKEVNLCKQIINVEQLKNRSTKSSYLYEKFVIKEEKVKNFQITDYTIFEDIVKTKKVNAYKKDTEVKMLTRDTEKYLSTKVEGINPKVEKMTTTAYCACTKCCDKSDGITASGDEALEWYTVAAGKRYKFGTVMYIPALSDKPNGGWFIVQDRGGAISDNRLDIYFNDHEVANMFSINEFDVYIYEF